jgi:hypothetical protein
MFVKNETITRPLIPWLRTLISLGTRLSTSRAGDTVHHLHVHPAPPSITAVMPMHQGLIPREGFCADVVLRLFRRTVLNPALLFPLVLLARFTKSGQDLAKLHPASRHLGTLFCVALVRWASDWASEKARNNWVNDKYDWTREIVLVTGGAGGIGGHMVKLLDERGITVVVLDVQPMSFAVCPFSRLHLHPSDPGPEVQSKE